MGGAQRKRNYEAIVGQFSHTVSMDPSGPKARVECLSVLVKLACPADMNEFRGETTTAFSILESKTTKGKPPSIEPQTFSEADHLPYFVMAATGGGGGGGSGGEGGEWVT